MALHIPTRFRLLQSAALALAATALSPVSASAQEEGPDAPDTAQPGYSSLNVSQPRGTRELQNALQRLALNPGDIDALIDGGNAALLLGDPQAALGFFARADEMSPGNGRVKAGLASSLLLNENPYEALRLFDEAKRLGVPESVFVADRGLAYDLVGNFDAAQADYELALRRGGDDETIRRYALSLGIAGDRAAAEAQLDPLLRKRDAAAWRTRAFVLAVTGDPQGAIAIADATMPKRMAASIQPFFRSMAKLTPAQQAAAAHFGQFPQSSAMGKDDPRNRQYASAGTPRPRVRTGAGRADAGLIPAGEPLGPSADSKSRKSARADKSQRRRPGRLSKKEQAQIAAAQAAEAAKPVPVQVVTAGPVPPSDLLIPGRGLPPAMVQAIPSSSSSAQRPVQMASAPTREIVQQIPSASSASTRATVQPTPSAPQTTAPSTLPPNVRTVTGAGALIAQVRSPVLRQGFSGAVAQPLSELPAPDGRAVARAAAPSALPPQPAQSAQVAPNADAVRPGFASLAQAQPTLERSATAGQLPPVASAPMVQPSSTAATTTSNALAAAAPAPEAPATRPSFDLAQVGPASSLPAATAAAAPATATTAAAMVQAVPPPAPAPARVSLAAIIADIKVPPQELAPNADAVDIMKLKPAPAKPVAPTAEDIKLAEAKKAEAKKAEARKAEAKKAAAAKAKLPKHPKRYWVQVAGGANRADLSKEWKRLVGVAPAAFKGKQGWWTPLNATNRLLTGPFGSDKEAQAFVNSLAKQKLSGFSFTSSEGQEVTKLGG